MIINHRALLTQLPVEQLCKESWFPFRVLGQVAGELAWIHSRETKVDASMIKYLTGINFGVFAVEISMFDNFKTNLFANTHWAVSEDMSPVRY